MLGCPNDRLARWALEAAEREHLPAPVAVPGAFPLELGTRIAESARAHEPHVHARNTVRAYRSDMRIFTNWCLAAGQQAIPAHPDVLCAFLLDCADGISVGEPRAAPTIERYLSAISTEHRKKGHPSPWDDSKVQSVLAAIRRKKALEGARPKKKKAFRARDLYKVVDAIPADMEGLRDRAIILVGFAGGFRRSELVAIDVEHLDRSQWGLAVHVGRSKTDQEGIGRVVGIHFANEHCPVKALEAWLTAAKIEKGPVFRGLRSIPAKKGEQRILLVTEERLSGESVADVVKGAVERVGMNPDDYAGHSLRSGFVTAADEAGKSIGQISAQTGHRDPRTVLGYMQSNVLGPKSAGFGLLD